MGTEVSFNLELSTPPEGMHPFWLHCSYQVSENTAFRCRIIKRARRRCQRCGLVVWRMWRRGGSGNVSVLNINPRVQTVSQFQWSFSLYWLCVWWFGFYPWVLKKSSTSWHKYKKIYIYQLHGHLCIHNTLHYILVFYYFVYIVLKSLDTVCLIYVCIYYC